MPEFEEEDGSKEDGVRDLGGSFIAEESPDGCVAEIISELPTREQSRYALKRGRLPQTKSIPGSFDAAGKSSQPDVADVANDAIGARIESMGKVQRPMPVKKSTEVVEDRREGDDRRVGEDRWNEDRGADDGRRANGQQRRDGQRQAARNGTEAPVDRQRFRATESAEDEKQCAAKSCGCKKKCGIRAFLGKIFGFLGCKCDSSRGCHDAINRDRQRTVRSDGGRDLKPRQQRGTTGGKRKRM
jgi:hypothetical protein